MISADSPDGMLPLSYSWSDGSPDVPALNGIPAGFYEVTITDANGCTGVGSIVLNEPPAILIDFDVLDESAPGAGDGSATAVVTGGVSGPIPPYLFLWDTGDSTDQIVDLFAGFYEVTVVDVNNCIAVASVEIFDGAGGGGGGCASLLVTIEETQPILCGGATTGALSALVNGGTAPYTFDWGIGIDAANIADLPEGSYFVEVIDADSCISYASYDLFGPAPIQIENTIVQVSTPGGNDGEAAIEVFGGAPPYLIDWSNGATGETITGLSAGPYGLTVTDSDGCFVASNVIVSLDSAICNLNAYVMENQPLYCFEDSSGQLEVLVTGGFPPYTYLWDNGETTAVRSGLSEGYYSVEVLDSEGCATQLFYDYYVLEPFWIMPIGIEESGPEAGDGMATVEINGGLPPFTYLWSNGSTSDTLTNLNAGTYEVTVTDASGCSDYFPVEVGFNCGFTATITEQTPITCFDGNDGVLVVNVSGGTGPFTYQWFTGETTNTASGLYYGFYEVVVTDANSCSSTASYFLIDPDPLIAITSTSNETTDGAFDGSASVSIYGGQAPFNYLWSTGDTTATISELAAGIYDLTVTDASGCNDITAVFVGSNDAGCMGLEVFTITQSNFNGYDISCFSATDAQVTTSVSGGAAPYTYQWDNESTASSLSNVGFGTYFLTVTDNNGCTGIADVTIVPPQSLLVIAAATAETASSANDGAISTSVFGGVQSYTYSWSNGATTANLSGLAPGTYTVTVSDANTCTYSLSATVDAANPDTDGDGVANSSDNCPFISNADQADSNNDGEGDACTCDPSSATLPSAAGIHRSAYSSKIDDWTHYCSVDGKLLLSLALDNTGAVIPENEVRLEIGESTTSYYTDSIGFIDNGVGGVFINRNWDVRPTTQPTSNVPVRYYFLNSEFEELNTELANYNLAPIPLVSDMEFFKITDPNLGIFPPLPSVPASALELVSNGTVRGVNTWVHSNHGSVDHIAEYEVYSFSGGGGGGSEAGKSLPVELMDFDGQLRHGDVHLSWMTASEQDNRGWSVQRRSGDNWEDLGFVQGAGNSFEIQQYAFTDSKINSGTHYYRLMQYDMDGQTSYSRIIAVQLSDETIRAAIYPNPVADQLTIKHAQGEARIFNSQGILIRTLKISDAIHRLSVAELQGGMYILELNLENGSRESLRFYKMKE